MIAMEFDNPTKVQYTLPDGWRWVRLGDICTFIRGVSFDKSEVSVVPSNHGIPILRAGNIQGQLITDSDLVWVETSKIGSEQYLRIFDIAICMSSGSPSVVGKTAQVKTPFHGSVGAFCGIIRPKTNSILGDYLGYWFHSFEFLKWRDNQARGANIQNLRFSELEKLLIPLPPLAEQQRIAALLAEQMAVVERARIATEAQLATARALPASYLRDVFESEEAQDWKVKSLNEITETTSGTTPSRAKREYYSGLIPWIKTGELKDGIITNSEESISEDALNQTSLKLLPKDTLLVAMYGQGQTRGRTGLLGIEATINQACFAILPNDKLFLPLFLQYWFRYQYWRLRSETENRGGNQPNLNGEILKRQCIGLPNIESQHRITLKLSEQLVEAERACAAITAQLDTINRLPAAMLRQAFNGEL